VERDRHQPGLFDVQSSIGDMAATQPLHTAGVPAGQGSGPPEQGPDEPTSSASEVTVAHAKRQAEILAELRAEFDARVAAAAEPVRAHRDDLNEGDAEDQGIGYGRSDDADESYSEQADQGAGLST
jgi:hypothetical protein